MQNRDLFLRDPREYGLQNHGVAKVQDRSDAVLRYELETFVCSGQYAEGLQRILEAYLERLGQAEQTSVWVSGFFGSGKSHLIKMLAALWENEPFSNGDLPREIVVEIPTSVTDLLRELDTKARPFGGTLALSGTLGSGNIDVPTAVASITLEGVGLPGEIHRARFMLWLRSEGKLDAVEAALAQDERTLYKELASLYVSPSLHAALAEAGLDVGTGGGAGQTLRSQFPKVTTLSTSDFVTLVRAALETHGDGGGIPATLLVLDEVQQTIGQSSSRALAVQEVAEACASRFDGRLLLVATGQQALTATPDLQKIAGRFFVKVQLHDADIEQVTRRVVLRKNPEHVDALRGALDDVAGEVERHLHGTPLGPRAEDAATLTADYPLLPVRRRVWEELLRVFDAEGTTSQLRSQLGIVHAAARAVADEPLGTVVPADFLYGHFEAELRNSGQVPREHLDAIAKLQGGPPDEVLMARVCALVYLLGKLETARPALGLRATPDVLADLLVSDLPEGSAGLRARLPGLLDTLQADGLVMEIDGAYRLQTRAGGEWEREYSRRAGTLKSGVSSDLAYAREQALKTAAAELVGRVKLTQGASKLRRDFAPGYGLDAPEPTGERIPLWIRTGWDVSESEALADARKLPTDSPVVVAYIPKLRADALEAAIRERLAAKGTLDFKGNVSTPEEQEAQSAMETRLKTAQDREREILRAIVDGTRVWTAGGDEVVAESPEEAVTEAGTRALIRLFPQFSLADDKRWGAVYRNATKGAGDALQAVGYAGEPSEQPLVKTVLDSLTGSQRGQELKNTFRASPYGWTEDDALNAALVVLVGAGLVKATHDGQPVDAKALDARRIGTTVFQREGIRLSAKQRLDLRRLLGKALGTTVNPNPTEEAEAARQFVDALRAAHAAAGGAPPAPEPPDARLVRELADLQGLALLDALRPDHAQALDDWRAVRRQMDARLPAHHTLEALARHAEGLDGAQDDVRQARAVRDRRMLLADPDPVPPLRKSLTALLRVALTDAQEASERVAEAGRARLDGDPAWAALTDEQRAALDAQFGLTPPDAPAVATEDDVLEALADEPLASRTLAADALDARFGRALQEAARLAAPKATRYSAPRRLVSSEGEVDAYVDELRAALLDKLGDGPVLIS